MLKRSVLTGMVLLLLGSAVALSACVNRHAGKLAQAKEGAMETAGLDKPMVTPAADGGAQSPAAAAGEKLLSFSAVSSLELELGSATVTVDSAASGSSAEARWSITRQAGSDAAPADSLSLEMDSTGGVLKIRDKYTGPKKARRPELKLTLSLPAGCSVECNIGNGTLTANTSGRQRLDLGNGTLILLADSADSEVNVGNGSLEATLAPQGGKTTLSVGNGSLKLKLGAGSDASYSVTTGIGQISLGGLPGTVTRNMLGAGASGSIGSGKAQLSLNVGNGGVQLSQ